MSFESDFFTKKDYQQISKNAQCIKERLERQRVLDKGHSDTLGEFLNHLLVYKKTDISSLSILSFISRNTISEIVNGKNQKPDLDTMMCICKGLKLEPDLSFFLLSKANHSVEHNHVYRILLEEYYKEDIVCWNFYLDSLGMDPLGRAKKDELDEKLNDMKDNINKVT